MIFEKREKTHINTEIEKLVEQKKYSYMEAVMVFCEKTNTDPEYIAKFLSKPIKEKLRAEGEALNLLPKSSKLPF